MKGNIVINNRDRHFLNMSIVPENLINTTGMYRLTKLSKSSDMMVVTRSKVPLTMSLDNVNRVISRRFQSRQKTSIKLCFQRFVITPRIVPKREVGKPTNLVSNFLECKGAKRKNTFPSPRAFTRNGSSPEVFVL